MTAFFGPAGNSESFSALYKASKHAPQWIKSIGLNAYEYQCGRGVNIGRVTAEEIGAEAARCGIQMSVHAPYFINLSSVEEERVEKNIRYILAAAEVATYMGGTRVVVHMGGLKGLSRAEALENSKTNIKQILKRLDQEGLGHIVPCIETMGRVNVMGDMGEVMEVCRVDERLLPCIDFGHLNARTHGGLKTYQDFLELFDRLENALGLQRARRFHSHFSKIEYSAGGEVKHLTFADTVYGPTFDYIGEIAAQRGYSPTFICESAGTQAEDALVMKKIFESEVGKLENTGYPRA